MINQYDNTETPFQEDPVHAVAESDGNEKSDRSVDKWKKSHLKTKIEGYEQEFQTLTQEFSRYNSYSIEGKIENGYRFDSNAKENRSLLQILDKMNHLVSNLVDNLKPQKQNPKPEAKNKSKPKPLKKGSTENNDISMFPDKEGHKLLEIFKHEFKQLDNKYKKISSSDFLGQLEGALEDCDNQIQEVEKRLRVKQLSYKQNNSNITRKVKTVKEEEITSITKIKSELETFQKLNEGSNDKINKLKQVIQEAEVKVQVKTETLKSIEADALKNNIKEFDESEQKDKQERKEFLIKKCGVLERQLKSINNKFEMDSMKALKMINKLKSENVQLQNEASKLKGFTLDLSEFRKKDLLPSITSKNNMINASFTEFGGQSSGNALSSTTKNIPAGNGDVFAAKVKEKSHKPSLRIKFDQPSLDAKKIEVQPPVEQNPEVALDHNENTNPQACISKELEPESEIKNNKEQSVNPCTFQQDSSRSIANDAGQEKKRERARKNEMAVLDELDIS